MRDKNPTQDPMVTEAQLSGCCGAKTRAGGRCGQVAMRNGRCHLHGGKSTGPRTADGIERLRAARTKHGWRGQDGRQLRAMIRQLKQASRELVALS